LKNCPFLGLDEDPQTSIDFASDRNYCYRTEKPTPILLEHQKKYCLAKNYPTCPVFQDLSHLTLPIDQGLGNQPEPKRSNSKGFWMMLVAGLLVGIIALSWISQVGTLARKQPIPSMESETGNTEFQTPTALPVAVQPEPTATLPSASFSSPSPTSTSSPTSTPAIGLYWGLETPSKTVPQLLIHQIGPGDSLALLAARHGTSVAAIQRVNYFLPVPLWEGVLVIVPLNLMDVSALPAFEPYQVKERSLTLKETAFALNTDPELVSRYNQTDLNAILPQDSWLLIPRPFPPPTGLPLETPDSAIQNYGG